MSVPNTFASATSSIPLANLDANFAYYDAAYSIAAGTMTVNYNLAVTGVVSGVGFSNYLASPPAIGGTAAAAGSFTTLAASSTVSGTGFSTYLASPPAIGGTAPAAGTYTAFTARTSIVVPAPAVAAISAAATLTNANIQAQIISATGTTYTITMPLGSTMETLVTWGAVNLGYDFFVVNTAAGTITMAANTGVTTLGSLLVLTGTSAHFRIQRTAANTFVLYRLS